jgi:2-methylisocitrate lyase-like PEP mutase family enzyme
LTARCENFLHDRKDLEDTIQRLLAYQQAGANVLYAPGLTRMEDIGAVVSAVERPVNVLATAQLSVSRLAEIGVRRISVGSALARAAYTALLNAAREIRDQGTFTYAAGTVSTRDFDAMFRL